MPTDAIEAFVREHGLAPALVGPMRELFDRLRPATFATVIASDSIQLQDPEAGRTLDLEHRPPTEEAEPLPAVPGRYEDLGPIGAGAMGEVRRVRDRELGRIAAFKDRDYDTRTGKSWGFFGYLDYMNDARLPEALLAEAVKWLREKGATEIVGPCVYSASYLPRGMLVDGDGIPDIAVGVAGTGVFNNGTVSLRSGVSGGSLWQSSGATFQTFGRALAGPGDLNGDGFPDVVALGEVLVRALSGTTHSVVTGVCLRDVPGGAEEVFHAESRVTMRRLEEREVAEYARSGEGLDKAGGYAIQEGGDRFVVRLEGSRSNVVGLPVEEVLARLAARGVKP